MRTAVQGEIGKRKGNKNKKEKGPGRRCRKTGGKKERECKKEEAASRAPQLAAKSGMSLGLHSHRCVKL